MGALKTGRRRQQETREGGEGAPALLGREQRMRGLGAGLPWEQWVRPARQPVSSTGLGLPRAEVHSRHCSPMWIKPGSPFRSSAELLTLRRAAEWSWAGRGRKRLLKMRSLGPWRPVFQLDRLGVGPSDLHFNNHLVFVSWAAETNDSHASHRGGSKQWQSLLSQFQTLNSIHTESSRAEIKNPFLATSSFW